MPNLLYFLHMVRSWRIDTEDAVQGKVPSTPVINIMASVEDPEKKPPVSKTPTPPSSAIAPIRSRLVRIKTTN